MQYLSELKSERGNADSETLDEADTSESVGSGFYVSNIKSGIKVSHLYKYNMYKSIICIYMYVPPEKSIGNFFSHSYSSTCFTDYHDYFLSIFMLMFQWFLMQNNFRLNILLVLLLL